MGVGAADQAEGVRIHADALLLGEPGDERIANEVLARLTSPAVECTRPRAAVTVIGFDPAPLKNEKGARFTSSCGEMVETKAIGRGTMQPMSSL